jgi:hypothetical protein
MPPPPVLQATQTNGATASYSSKAIATGTGVALAK